MAVFSVVFCWLFACVRCLLLSIVVYCCWLLVVVGGYSVFALSEIAWRCSQLSFVGCLLVFSCSRVLSCLCWLWVGTLCLMFSAVFFRGG